MPGQTMDEIEARIAGSPNLSDENHEALLQRLKMLRTEVTDLSATSVEDAHNITAYAAAATRPEQNEDVIQNAIDSMSSAVEKVEGWHPTPTQAVTDICSILARMGI
jgi:hypothetical protein